MPVDRKSESEPVILDYASPSAAKPDGKAGRCIATAVIVAFSIPSAPSEPVLAFFACTACGAFYWALMEGKFSLLWYFLRITTAAALVSAVIWNEDYLRDVTNVYSQVASNPWFRGQTYFELFPIGPILIASLLACVIVFEMSRRARRGRRTAWIHPAV
jgi:hypothetical protein